MATDDAIQCVDAATPKVPRISGRVVKTPQGRDHAECGYPPGWRVFLRRHIFNRHGEIRGIGLHTDRMGIAADRRIRPDLHLRPLRPDACKRQRRCDIDIGRKAARRLPCASGEDFFCLFKSID
jgi:hypothetical protein